MLGKGGGVVEASIARIRCAWGEFNAFIPTLTMRGAYIRLNSQDLRSKRSLQIMMICIVVNAPRMVL